MRTFNLKNCLKEIEKNRNLEVDTSYWIGWNDAHKEIIEIINSNIKEKYNYCKWKYHNGYELRWIDTSCDNAKIFIAGGIKENNYKFCPYCGKPIKEIK